MTVSFKNLISELGQETSYHPRADHVVHEVILFP